MDLWVIDYALHLKSLKEAESSQIDVAGFGDAVEACLVARGFEKLESLGLHASDRLEAISDAYLACSDLSAIDGSEKFVSKLNLFRVSDVNNLLPVLVAGQAAAGRQIDAEPSDNTESPDSDNGITIASTVAAVVQDLFLDSPEQIDHKPPPLRFRNAEHLSG